VHPDVVPSLPFQSKCFGLVYSSDLACYLDWNIYFHGTYEFESLLLLQHVAHRVGSRQAVFVDVGANIGIHTLAMCNHVAKVHAFEPWEHERGEA